MLNGGLFTREFLIEGICDTEAWTALDDRTVEHLRQTLVDLLGAFGKLRTPTEAETEKDLIWPLLEAVGWRDMSVQQNISVKAREDVPDALLFADAEAKAKAAPLAAWKRFQHGACIVEAKRWNRVLDREEARRKADDGVPSTQMLRYLRRVDDVTGGRLRWGILTNGRHWRLYFRGALSVADDFLEIDLGRIFNLPGCEVDLLSRRPDRFADDASWQAHGLKLFLLLFGRDAFLPGHRGETLHQLALREGKQWEARVARDLSDTVFDVVFPELVQALAAADGKPVDALDAAALEDIRKGALIFLYRLLFVLYAEDRNLLPDESGPYAEYAVTKLRHEIAEKKALSTPFSDRMKAYWSRLDGVFQAIAQGDDDLGVPPYNGGLFDPATAPILTRVQLPDAALAEIVFRLSHIDTGDGRPPKYINYRDLSVQQLGSVYERILEHGLKIADGRVAVAIDPAARKSSGSYYTPEELVALIIDRAVKPLVDEQIDAFVAKATALASETRSKEARLAELLPYDPASRLLGLKICDPAMGSGHFLVSLVDWLADWVLDAMAEASAVVTFVPYVSPLAQRIDSIRARILAETKAHGWPLAESQLDDRHIVRRMVLKRVVYGVDKNPMAVELAKVSLWLHSFTVGAPLSFLDHHLCCGDSVVGAWARPTVEALKERGALFNIGTIASVEKTAEVMETIEETTDSDITEVKASRAAYGLIEEKTAPIGALFSLLTAESLMGIFDKAPKKAPPAPEKMAGKSAKQLATWRQQVRDFEAAAAFQLALEGVFGDLAEIASGEARVASEEVIQQLAQLPKEADPQSSLFPTISVTDRRRVLADRLVADARALAEHHRFFHWEIAFPNVWSNLLSAEPTGGFDAVIGNPPYVRQELLGDAVKRALKTQYAAFDGMADLYVYFYEQGLRLLRPGGRMSFVVTNKWLKAGYAEALRDLFTTAAHVEFIADFGHAKHFFPDADVFPSVIAIRKPIKDGSVPSDTQVCVIPRDVVPEKGLSAAVAAATYPLPLAHFTKESWTLEPPDVVALLRKIRENGVPLADYSGVKPLYGVKTGLNEVFLVDSATRDRLVSDDPRSAEIIKPYLRGQDIERWWSPWNGLWMIFTRRGIEIDRYKSVKNYLQGFRQKLEPKPSDWSASHETDKWSGRKEGNYAWYEVQDPVEYWAEFQKPKLLIKRIEYYADFSLDDGAQHVNDSALILPTVDRWLLSCANSAASWYYRFKLFPHKKDEALAMDIPYVELLPIATSEARSVEKAVSSVNTIIARKQSIHTTVKTASDWLRFEFGLDKLNRAMAEPHKLDADGFVAAVRGSLPKSRKWSAADIARLKQEYADTLTPAREAAAEILSLERKLSDIVNAAYGLTPDEVALMWRTAPPRMPLDPAEELRRLGAGTT